MWYNESLKNVVLGNAANVPNRIHLIGDVPMSTVPPHAHEGNSHTIYALLDPRDLAIRYIGITYDVYQRMRQHSRCEGNNDAKNAWIRELQREQLMFIMHSLEKVDTYELALERESYWIHHYLQQGANLTNLSGLPVDQKAPAVKKVRLYKPDQFKRLYFRSYTGQIVNFYEATDDEFDEFIKRYFEVEENAKYPGWAGYQRRRAVNYAMKQEVELEFCNESASQAG